MIRKIIQTNLILGNSLRISKRLCSNIPPSSSGTSTYEGDGKTSVSVLNNDLENGILINAISQAGFRLNNDIFVVGPMVIFPRSVISWNIEHFEHIDERSLSVFKVLEPKIDIVIIGIGDQRPTAEFQKKILSFMRKYNINIEVLQTERACATFNFLNSEGRMVAACLIPPATLSVSEDDYARYMLEKQNLLSLEQ